MKLMIVINCIIVLYIVVFCICCKIHQLIKTCTYMFKKQMHLIKLGLNIYWVIQGENKNSQKSTELQECVRFRINVRSFFDILLNLVKGTCYNGNRLFFLFPKLHMFRACIYNYSSFEDNWP